MKLVPVELCVNGCIFLNAVLCRAHANGELLGQVSSLTAQGCTRKKFAAISFVSGSLIAWPFASIFCRILQNCCLILSCLSPFVYHRGCAEWRGQIRGKRAVKIAPQLHLAFRLCTHGSQIQFISQIRSEIQSLHFYLQVIRLDLVVTWQASVTPLMTWFSNAVAMFSKWSLAKL